MIEKNKVRCEKILIKSKEIKAQIVLLWMLIQFVVITIFTEFETLKGPPAEVKLFYQGMIIVRKEI